MLLDVMEFEFLEKRLQKSCQHQDKLILPNLLAVQPHQLQGLQDRG